jgi:hypothetical protein
MNPDQPAPRLPRPGRTGLLWALALGAAIHADWHLARPHHFRLSLEWGQHWLLAVPMFALIAMWVTMLPPAGRWKASALIIGGGVLVGQFLEPLYEKLFDGGSWAEVLPPERWAAFGGFMAAGLLSYAAVMAFRSRSRAG